MEYALLFAALAATTNFTAATAIQSRDDRPTFGQPFKLSVWFKLDPEQFKKDKSLAVTIRGGTNASDTEAERSITGAAELHLAKISLAGQVAFLGGLLFERPTDKPRNTTVTLVHEHKSYKVSLEPSPRIFPDTTFSQCGITLPKEAPVFEVSWVEHSGLDMFVAKG